MGAGRLFHFLVAMPTSEDLFISAKHLLIYRAMYALADASGAIAMTRIIRRVAPRAKRLHAANEDGAAKGHVRHFEFAIS